MNRDKQQMIVHIPLDYNDSIAEMISQIPDGIPHDSVFLQYDNDLCGNNRMLIWLSYTRLETDDECDHRIASESRKSQLNLHDEMELYERLKAKYENWR
jgi:hypothetical protein